MDTNGGGRSTKGSNSAPSWQDYINALSREGARYRPASLTKALKDRERAGGNPRAGDKESK